MKCGFIEQKRDVRLDILKSLALLCIILAHSKPPEIIFQLRNFDVPLLVIISGMLFVYSKHKESVEFFRYLGKRIRRLLVPTWVFLIFCFLFAYVSSLFMGQKYPFSFTIILRSFLLCNRPSISYVWIIRVFLLLALIAPLLSNLQSKLTKNFKYFVLIIYFIYELTYQFYKPFGISALNDLVKNYIFYILPYGCLFGLGMCLKSFKRRSIAILSLMFFLVFLYLSFSLNFNYLVRHSDKFIFTQRFKYPARLYYLSYGVSCSLFLFCIFFNYKCRNNIFERLAIFISRNSLWMFLWLMFWDTFLPKFKINFIENFFIKVCLVLLSVFAQQHLKRFYNLRFGKSRLFASGK